MKKIFLPVLLGMFLNSCQQNGHPGKENTSTEIATMESHQSQDSMHSFYDFKATDLSGNIFDFSTLKEKRVLIVNTASECGYTPQYAQLQDLYSEYENDDFVIIGFPSNDFGGQEPGSAKEISQFCEKNYGVTFPMMDKISTKGKDQHPVFAWLTRKELNGKEDVEVKWNFNKFLIDENGNWVAYYPSGVEPLDERIVNFAGRK